MSILRASKWSYNTGATGGISIEFAMASGGTNSAQLAFGLSSPAMVWLAEEAIAQAPAVLVMGGTTAGLQAGAGIGILLGYLH